MNLSRRSLRALVTMCGLALLASSARAEPKKKIRDELPDNARAAWDAGVQAMQENPPEWARAAAKMQEAYDLSHNPRVLFNVGVAERNLEHYSRALARFKQELAEGGGKISAQDRGEIQTTIAALEKLVSSLELTVNEPDATVFVDDYRVGVTPTPPIPVDVKSTPHVLRVEKDGFLPYEKRDLIVASSSPVKIAVELEPKEKTAEVEVSVTGAPGASIWIDDIDRGPAPYRGLLDVGRHKFEARQPGFEPTAQTQEVVYKQNLKLQLPLERAQDSAPVRIETIDGAGIEINGKLVGTTAWEGPVQLGTATINVRKEGFNPASIEIEVKKGTMTTRRVALTAEKKNDWVFWTVGSVLVIAGATVTAALVFAPSNQAPVFGTLDPTIIKAGHGIHF